MTDYALGTTIYIQFTTRSFSTGVPTTLAGTPALSVLEENNATPITAGVSVSVDRASVTGLNEATIVATSGNGYESGKDYGLYISTGTVGGVSVVGEVVGRFSIEKSSALRPTTAGRTLDVTATGAAGVDWANVENPSTSVNLSGTSISTSQVVASVSGAVGSVTGNVGGNVTGSVGSVVGAVGSVTGNVGGNVTGSVGSVTAPVTVGSNNDKTGYALTAAYDAAKTAAQVSDIPTAVENADALLTRDWTSVTGEAARSVLNALRFLRNKWSIALGVLTVTEEDDTTTAWTGAVTTAASDPVNQIDPT